MIPDLPETLITGREREYLDWFLRRKTANPEAFSDADLEEYLRVFKKADGLRAGLAYYRAASLSAQQAWTSFFMPASAGLIRQTSSRAPKR